MLDGIKLEKQANLAAREMMGEVGWPTVILGVSIIFAYVCTVVLLLNQQISQLIAYLLASYLTYAIYTVMHDAVHGSIQGKNKSFAWLNNGLGYLAGQIIFISFKVHQQEHLAHHRHTNKVGDDPDLFVRDDSLKSLIRGTFEVFYVQYQYFFSKSWQHASARDKAIVWIELLIMVAWRLALILAGYWWESLVLFGFATVSGVFILVVLFVWLVHRPHEQTERYKNTNTIVFPAWADATVTWLWLFQNYHSIHHLFPRVPFYKYKKLFKRIEPIMLANNAPITRIGD